MACPAGHGNTVPPSNNGHQPAFEKPHIFDTIQDPEQLRMLTEDCIFLLGGHFAILCQFAHPGLAEGSYKHSNFAYRIMNRLKTTARFLNAAVMGTQQEKEAIFSVIHASHAAVRGDNYYADDPELHKWTAATLFVSLLVVHEAYFGKVPRARQEVLFRESAVYATSLRMPPEMWPATLDDFWAYWNRGIETLEVTDWARSLARDLMYPKNVPLWYRPAAPMARLLTTHWLPERLQREYGMRQTPLNTFLYHVVVGNTALVWPWVPRALKQRPSKYYVRDMRKSVRRIEQTGSWEKAKS